MNFLVLLISIVAFSGFTTLAMSFTAIRRLTDGVLKSYAIAIWYALIFFSIGGGLHSYKELAGTGDIAGLTILDVQYIFYILYYVMLLFAFFLIYKLYVELGFDQRVMGMKEAIAEMEKVDGGR